MHFPPWLAYPLLPLFAIAAVGMPLAKRRKIAWLSGFAICAFILSNIDFEKLGPQTGPLLDIAFCLLGVLSLTVMVVRDVVVVGGLLSMDAKDWQEEFDEAGRLMSQKFKKAKRSDG